MEDDSNYLPVFTGRSPLIWPVVVTDTAISQFRKLGLGRGVKKEDERILIRMINDGVWITHEKGNRRYQRYILKYNKNSGKLHSISVDDGRQQVPCPACEGACRRAVRAEPCDFCNNLGFVVVR